jgi:hypothetical protein
MRPEVCQLLEAMSAYRELYPSHAALAHLNPVAYSHIQIRLGRLHLSVISRVGPTAADHTQRANKLAHHLVISRSDQVAAGPAALCSAPGLFIDAWEGEPALLPHERPLQPPPAVTGPATAWEACTGDAGWAGVLAHQFLARPRTPVYLVFEPGLDLRALFAEAAALVPQQERWRVTFSTYFTFLPAGATCQWRGCTDDSEALREARHAAQALVLDLRRPLPRPDPGPFVEAARTGRQPAEKEPVERVPTPLGLHPTRGRRLPFVRRNPLDGRG